MTKNLISTINIFSIVNEGLNSSKSIKTINKIKKENYLWLTSCRVILFFFGFSSFYVSLWIK